MERALLHDIVVTEVRGSAMDATQTVWTLTAQELLELDLADTVLVTAGSTKSLREYLDEAAQLRDRGLLT